MNTIIEQIIEIVRKITEDDKAEIIESTTAQDVSGWDSLSHIYIITEVEKHFDIKFSAVDAYNMKSVGDFCKIVETKSQQN